MPAGDADSSGVSLSDARAAAGERTQRTMLSKTKGHALMWFRRAKRSR